MFKPFLLLRTSLVLLILWPAYIAYKADTLPALSPDRLILFLLIIFSLLHIVYKTRKANNTRNYKIIILLVLCYFLWNIVTSVVASNDMTSSITATLNWFIIGPFILIASFLFVDSEVKINKILTTIIISIFIVNIFGLIEIYLGRNLFEHLLITENKYTLIGSSSASRDGLYRARSVFSNPLVYAQFLLAVIPLQLYIYQKSKGLILNMFLSINIVLSIFLVYTTGSRAGLGFVIIIPFLIQYISLYKKKYFKYLSLIFIIIGILGASVFINNYIESNRFVIDNLNEMNIHGKVSEEDISTFARIIQFEYGSKSISAHPLFGIGFGQAVKAVYPLISIDNYYLTMIISTGIIGLLFLVTFIFLVITRSIRSIRLYHDDLIIYLLVSFLIIIGYYLILSISKANILLFSIGSLIFIKSNLLKIQNA